MNQPPPTGKRIVSKGEYVKVQGLRVGLVCFGVTTVLLCLASVAFLLTELGRNDHTPPGKRFENQVSWQTMLLVLAIVGAFIYFMNRMTELIGSKVTRIEPGVPLTRANTADLPANDTLVRAGAEPTQQQQAVLLRAATQTQERHEEQLVRAAMRDVLSGD